VFVVFDMGIGSSSALKRDAAVPHAAHARDIVQKKHVKREYKFDKKSILGEGAYSTVRCDC
jgi:hypothetical protein